MAALLLQEARVHPKEATIRDCAYPGCAGAAGGTTATSSSRYVDQARVLRSALAHAA